MKTVAVYIYDSDVFNTFVDDEIDTQYFHHYHIPEELLNEYKKIKQEYDLVQEKLYNFTKNNPKHEPKSWWSEQE